MLGAGKISLDGTKIKASASVKQSKDADALDKEIDRILRESIEIDEAEDEMYGESSPYQIPEELANKKRRLEKIQDAKEKLEKENLDKINVTDTDAKIMKHKDGSRNVEKINGSEILCSNMMRNWIVTIARQVSCYRSQGFKKEMVNRI